MTSPQQLNHETAPKAVLFDLDDTLFDHMHSSRQGLVAAIKDHRNLQRAKFLEVERLYTRLLDEYHIQVLQGKISLEQARFRRMQELFEYYEVLAEEQQIEQAIAQYVVSYRLARQPVSGSLQLLQALHGRVHIAIVTNNITAEQKEKLQECGLEPFVDTLITSEDVGAIKPDPAIFESALQRIGCSAQEAVMLGDSWSADIIGAQRAGIRAIWLNRTGMSCPDPALATELQALEPLDTVLTALGIGMQDSLSGEIATETMNTTSRGS
jgi:HAD superfamily hydrolase (TIGR01509 family)